jgi:hypothetical protein
MSRRVRPPTGQISIDSGIGRWIALLASLDSVTSIVEVGTWRGNGSTTCIADGLLHRSSSDALAWCLEVDAGMAREAARRHRRSRGIQVIWGRLVETGDLDLHELSADEQVWARADLELIRRAPNVTERLPDSIDLLVLDGGEFSTYAEYRDLRARVTQWLVLDDTRTRKGRRIAGDIVGGLDSLFSPAWISNERNGVLVAKRCTDLGSLGTSL